jgi:hypothetical protein
LNEPARAERDQAIRLLTGMIPKETSANIRMLMQNRQTPWHLALHFGLGLRVRNALREAGFNWRDGYLDDHWRELVEEAAQVANRGE